MAKLQEFLFARCRGGAELTAIAAVGVRTCEMAIVVADLKERGMYSEHVRLDLDEEGQRQVLEERLRLEDEKNRMKVLRRDQRFEPREPPEPNMYNDPVDTVNDDIGRVLIDTLHAPMRMNEKVLYFLYMRAYDNKNKKQSSGVMGAMTTKLRAMGTLGDGWDVQFEGKDKEKMSSFALPLDQSKRIFNKGQRDGLYEVVDLACGKNADDAVHMKSFIYECAPPPVDKGRNGVL